MYVYVMYMYMSLYGLLLSFDCSPVHTPVSVQRGLVPIHYAANEGRLEAVRTLVNECHCDPEIRDVVSHKQLQTYHRCSYVRTCMHMYVHTCTMTGGGGQWHLLILHVALQ